MQNSADVIGGTRLAGLASLWPLTLSLQLNPTREGMVYLVLDRQDDRADVPHDVASSLMAHPPEAAAGFAAPA